MAGPVISHFSLSQFELAYILSIKKPSVYYRDYNTLKQVAISMIIHGQMASQTNVITKCDNTAHSRSSTFVAYLPHDSHMSLPVRRKWVGGAAGYFFKSTTLQGQQQEFYTSLLAKLTHLPISAFYHRLAPPSYSKIDILISKKTSKASVNEMCNACYSSYVSFTSNLWT